MKMAWFLGKWELHFFFLFFTPGNIIKPKEATKVPHVEFSSSEHDPDSLWTLVLTNPDGHFTDESSEYLHWMVGNIKGSDIASGQTVCDYLQPFPPKGTGYHRYIFVLYKQVSAKITELFVYIIRCTHFIFPSFSGSLKFHELLFFVLISEIWDGLFLLPT